MKEARDIKSDCARDTARSCRSVGTRTATVMLRGLVLIPGFMFRCLRLLTMRGKYKRKRTHTTPTFETRLRHYVFEVSSLAVFRIAVVLLLQGLHVFLKFVGGFLV